MMSTTIAATAVPRATRKLASCKSTGMVGAPAGAVALRRTPVQRRKGQQAARGDTLRVYAAKLVLKNCGPKTTDHLSEDIEIPGDLELAAGRMVVGRQASESVSLEVCVPTVSGAHAMIEVAPDKVMVTDLSSTNGTFIEGEELQPGVAYELPQGGEVIFGDEFLACYELSKED